MMARTPSYKRAWKLNAFGTAKAKFPLFDPRLVRENRARFGRDNIPGLERANGIYIPTGRQSVCGWILMRRDDYDELDKYATTLQLEVGDPNADNNVGTLKNLAIVQAQCVTRGIAADEDALYLVEITDGRGILCNQWFQFPLTAQYNIRAPAYPQTFHPDSMDSGTTWTWASMVKDIWDRMGTFLGTWPGLPTTPTGTPEGFWFSGVPAWTALCDVLDHLGLTVACDLTLDDPYTIVDSGAADADFAELQVTYGPDGRVHRLEDDLEWIDVGAGRAPKTVTVLFRRRNEVYGTEETVYYGNDDMAKQWNMDSIYSVSVPAPAEFDDAVGEHFLWSDFTVRYDDSSNPLDDDVATATAIAQERVTQYFARIDPDEYLDQIYTGALPFVTGSRVSWLIYYQDHRLGDRQGWRTRIMCGKNPMQSYHMNKD